MNVSLPYKYIKFENFSPISCFNDIQEEKRAEDSQMKQNETHKENDIKNLRLSVVYKQINDSWNHNDQAKMLLFLGYLCEYCKIKPLTLSIEFINYQILDHLYSCLTENSPSNLMTKTLELFALIYKFPKNTSIGCFFISNENCIIDVLRKLILSLIRFQNPFVYLVLVCLEGITNFSIEGCEKVLTLFFKGQNNIIEKIIKGEIDTFSPTSEISDICCKLIRTISQMRINQQDSINLFCLICNIWTYCERHSLSHLVWSINNLLKKIPDTWEELFVEKNAEALVLSCLVVDDSELAVPAVCCIVQLIAQQEQNNLNFNLNFRFFSDMFKNIELVSLSCWAIERILLIQPKFIINFIQNEIIGAISSSFENFTLSLKDECIQCLCSIIDKCELKSVIIEFDIISLFVEYIQISSNNNLLKLNILLCFEKIFDLSLIDNDLKEIVIKQFSESIGCGVMDELSHITTDANISFHLGKLSNQYKNLVMENFDNNITV